MAYTIDLDGLRTDNGQPYVPPASESAARKRLYYFWRGLAHLLNDLFGRMEVYYPLARSTGLWDEEVAAFDEMLALRAALGPAVDWAATQYGGCELLEPDGEDTDEGA
jgi:hypothetical protein